MDVPSPKKGCATLTYSVYLHRKLARFGGWRDSASEDWREAGSRGGEGAVSRQPGLGDRSWWGCRGRAARGAWRVFRWAGGVAGGGGGGSPGGPGVRGGVSGGL